MEDVQNKLIQKFKKFHNVEVKKLNHAKELVIHNSNLTIITTLPNDALEWFVEVYENENSVVSDWYDHEGYDDTPRNKLKSSMYSDIDRFLSAIATHNIRLMNVLPKPETKFTSVLRMIGINYSPKVKRILELQVDNSWHQTVPFCWHIK
ncbi:hypothetical protein F9L33_01395 [Amylibacter sp. SFDW26]|uniref:hypothetical protein n=1 Tax=Amylibacter sp. SFDW26 TaxID=2652722 RepID=UPI001261D115|nr:hypothetical protein [Amylibacter sp. SFDW26]KAB7615448.1 hypothetical protein F9L33_01395 [Amylibacter sp. SFDW26]